MLFRKDDASASLKSVKEKNMELKMVEMKGQLEGLKNYIDEKEKNYKKLESHIREFCQNLLEKEFALSQIGGGSGNILNMGVFELLDFTNIKLENMISESDNKLTLTVSTLIEKKKAIEDLERQIHLMGKDRGDDSKIRSEIEVLEKKLEDTKNYVVEEEENPLKNNTAVKNSIKSSVLEKKEENKPNQNPKEDKIKNTNEPQSGGKKIKSDVLKSLISSFEKVVEKPIKETPTEDELPSRVIEVKDEDLREKFLNKRRNIPHKNNKKVINHLVDLNKIMNSMPDIHWQIIEAIGVKGLSERDDIVKYLLKKLDIKENSLSVKTGNALGEMRVSDIVRLSKINTGCRTFYAYSLTDTGKRVFIESGRFEGEPVLCEVQLLEKDHSSAYHGYGIKDSAQILRDLGYTDVTITRKENTRELDNGDTFVPDIVGNSPLTGEEEYFEYELGHHKQSDFDRKCTKMRLATKTLYFIVPDVVKRDRVKNQIDDWRFNMGKRAEDVDIKITTTRNLKKGKWDTDF